jgi:hypothetical protein
MDMAKAQLVRLSTILKIDPTVEEVGDLPDGFLASRRAIGSPWSYEKDSDSD